jgi:hypothetical protein
VNEQQALDKPAGLGREAPDPLSEPKLVFLFSFLVENYCYKIYSSLRFNFFKSPARFVFVVYGSVENIQICDMEKLQMFYNSTNRTRSRSYSLVGVYFSTSLDRY